MLGKLFGRKNLSKGGIKKDSGLSKRIALFFLIFFALAQISVFATGGTQGIQVQDPTGTLGSSGLSTVLGYIVGFFGSPYMKAICIIALGGLGIGVLMNRGEPGMVKKFIPWIVGIAILLSLIPIVSIIWGNGGDTTSTITNGR